MTNHVHVGLVGEAVAVIDEARIHGYSSDAAFCAAAAHLEGVSHQDAILIAVTLAMWIATDLNPTAGPRDLGEWLEGMSAMLPAHTGGGAPS